MNAEIGKEIKMNVKDKIEDRSWKSEDRRKSQFAILMTNDN